MALTFTLIYVSSCIYQYKLKMNNNNIIIKAVLIGSQSVGRSSLLIQIRNEGDITNYIGYSYSNIQYKNITFSIWDDEGCALYNSIYEKIFNQTDYFIIIYEPFQQETFEDAKSWYFFIKRYKVIYLIINRNQQH